MKVTRLVAGKYLVDGRWRIVRVSSLGGLYDNGPAWRWEDTKKTGGHGVWLDTKKAALTDLIWERRSWGDD